MSRLFSGPHMRSPVSRRALGECNAITSRGFGHSGLTFVSSLETTFRASYKSSNLRPASTSQQNVNRKKSANNITGYHGVSRHKASGTYRVSIQKDGKRNWVGQFDSAIEAAIARDAVAEKLHGKFAVLNFPEKAKKQTSLVT